MRQLMKRWTVMLPLALSVFVLLAVTLAQQITATGVNAQMSLGNKFLQELNYEEAIVEFAKVIQIDRKNSQAYLGLADAYLGTGRSDLAIAILEDFSKKYQNAEVLEKLLNVYIRDGKYEEANKIVNTLIEQTDDDRYYQKQDEIVAMIGERTVPIAFSSNYILFTTESALYGMGKNMFGEMGSADNLGDAAYNSTTPKKLPFSATVRSLAAGSATSYIVDSNGSLWTSGMNLAAQQGNGSTIQHVTAFTQVPGISTVASVAAGSTYAMALCSDGTVWAMGNNSFGQLGLEQRLASTPIQVEGLKNIISVRAATQYNLSIKADGRMYAMGILPDGRTFTTPTVIEEKVVAASVADDYFAFVDWDGNLILRGNSRVNLDNLSGMVKQASNGVEFIPNGYSIVQVECTGSALGLLTAEGDVTILTRNGVEAYQLPKANRLYMGEGAIAILDGDASLHLYSFADGILTPVQL